MSPKSQEEKIPYKITGPHMVKIWVPMPNTCPSFLNSMAGAATELANPVIGTRVPAPPYFAILLYILNPVNTTLKNTKVIVLYSIANSILAPRY